MAHASLVNFQAPGRTEALKIWGRGNRSASRHKEHLFAFFDIPLEGNEFHTLGK